MFQKVWQGRRLGLCLSYNVVGRVYEMGETKIFFARFAREFTIIFVSSIMEFVVPPAPVQSFVIKPTSLYNKIRQESLANAR